jgi:RNA polymerase sigma-70 factor (ECF subfamily)
VKSSSPQESEAQLIAAAKGGDDAAFTLLVAPYYGKLAGWLEARVGGVRGDREFAAQIEQMAFDAARKGIAGFRAESTFKTWLFGNAERLAWDAVRKRLPLDRYPERAELATKKIDERAFKAEPRRFWRGDPAKILMREQRGRLKSKACDLLSKELRAVFVLRMREMNYRDIAKALDISEDAARRRFSDAKDKVAAYVKRHEQPQGKYRPELKGVFK